MSIDVNKLRTTSKQVESISGYAAGNQLGVGKGMAGNQTGIDPNKFRDSSKATTSVQGFVATNTVGGDQANSQKISQAGSSVDTNKLRATSKQVTAIGGAVASLKG